MHPRARVLRINVGIGGAPLHSAGLAGLHRHLVHVDDLLLRAPALAYARFGQDGCQRYSSNVQHSSIRSANLTRVYERCGRPTHIEVDGSR